MNETIDIKAIDIIINDYYHSHNEYELSRFKSFTRQTLASFNVEADIFDVLFIPGKHKCSILHYFVIENKHDLFKELLEEYSKQFKLIPPSQWEFILMEKENDCYKNFINFYGEEYLKKIIQSNLSFVTGYSEPSFKKYYLNGDLDHFYKLENIQTFDKDAIYEMVQALNFFDNDKEGFKQFMLNQANESSKKNSSGNYKYESLIYHVNKESVKRFKDGKEALLKDITLTLPCIEEVDILIEKWGINKTSQVISDYLNFQKEYTINTNKNNLLKVTFIGDILNDLIKKQIKFINCGEALSFGLKHNAAHLSYFLINGTISKDDLLMHITDKELKKEATYNLLNEQLITNNEKNIKKLKV